MATLEIGFTHFALSLLSTLWCVEVGVGGRASAREIISFAVGTERAVVIIQALASLVLVVIPKLACSVKDRVATQRTPASDVLIALLASSSVDSNGLAEATVPSGVTVTPEALLAELVLRSFIAASASGFTALLIIALSLFDAFARVACQ